MRRNGAGQVCAIADILTGQKMDPSLRGLGRLATVDGTKGPENIEIVISVFNPDGLPLDGKVFDKVQQGSLTFKLSDAELSAKINDGKLFYVEEGKIKNDPSSSKYCSLYRAAGFTAVGSEYTVANGKFSDAILFGQSRQMHFYLGDGFLAFECTITGDITPFVVSDLQTIFGSLAVIKAG